MIDNGVMGPSVCSRGGIVPIDVPSPIPRSGGRSATAREGFHEVLAGGPIRSLTIRRIRITERGITIVEHPRARFGPDRANEIMVSRLRAILRGQLKPDESDSYFSAHELREFVHHRRLNDSTQRGKCL